MSIKHWRSRTNHANTSAFKARWCDHTYSFRRTAKNLVAYATSWSLILSPVMVGSVWIGHLSFTKKNTENYRDFDHNSKMADISVGNFGLLFKTLRLFRNFPVCPAKKMSHHLPKCPEFSGKWYTADVTVSLKTWGWQ